MAILNEEDGAILVKVTDNMDDYSAILVKVTDDETDYSAIKVKSTDDETDYSAILVKVTEDTTDYSAILVKGLETKIELPPYTIRFKTNRAVTQSDFSMGTLAVVDADNNIYDLTYENRRWYRLLFNKTFLTEVIAANTTGITNIEQLFYLCSSLTTVPLFDTSRVTNMKYMFSDCSTLTTVPLFDTSSVIEMNYMFQNCKSLTSVPLFDTSSVTSMDHMFYMSDMYSPLLTSVPLFDTSSVTNMNNMFYNCRNVESGALALYQQASSQGTVTSHAGTFKNCGFKTETGAAELAQIPSDWK